MSIASRKKTVRGREYRHVLDSHAHPRNGLFETPAEEQRGTDQIRAHARLSARAQPQGPAGMLDRQIRLPGPQSQKAADEPAARIARIKGESAIDQHDHRIDVLAETGER